MIVDKIVYVRPVLIAGTFPVQGSITNRVYKIHVESEYEDGSMYGIFLDTDTPVGGMFMGVGSPTNTASFLDNRGYFEQLTPTEALWNYMEKVSKDKKSFLPIISHLLHPSIIDISTLWGPPNEDEIECTDPLSREIVTLCVDYALHSHRIHKTPGAGDIKEYIVECDVIKAIAYHLYDAMGDDYLRERFELMFLEELDKDNPHAQAIIDFLYSK